MNQMIHEGINEFPGDKATVEQFLATMPSIFTRNIEILNTILFSRNS
jgi:hypothetical protein